MVSLQKSKNLIRGFYPILDASYTPDYPVYKLAEEILSSGVGLLQLRQKNLSEGEFLKMAQEIFYLKIHNPFTLIINHFVNVAKELDAEGVHLGAGAPSITDARAILGEDKIIGVSVHSIDEGIQKEKEGADYLTFGSIYPSATKNCNHPVQGLEKLSALVKAVSIPVVAVGGISLEKISEIKRTGSSGFSAITSISQSANPAESAARFKAGWQ